MAKKKVGRKSAPAKKAAKRPAKRKASDLNPRQTMFVKEYLIDLNATAAYKRAGYVSQGNAAEVGAQQLLRNTKVASAIKNAMDSRGNRLEITADRILQEVARIAFFDNRKLFDAAGNLKSPSEWDDDTAAALSGIDVTEEFSGKGEARERVGFTKKVKSWDKVSALTLAMRHRGMLTDRQELGGIGGGPIQQAINVAMTPAEAYKLTLGG